MISAKTERFLVLKLTKTHTKEFGWMMWQDIIFSSSSIVFISTFYFGFLFYQNATMFLSILWSCGWIQWKTHEIIYDAPKHNQTLPFNFYSHYRFVRSLFDSPIFHYNNSTITLSFCYCKIKPRVKKIYFSIWNDDPF